MPAPETTLTQFQRLFRELGPGDYPGLYPVYHPRVCFQDPMVTVTGRDNLAHHLEKAYRNVIHCGFDFGTWLDGRASDELAITWVMHLRHRRLAGGRSLTVEGMSHLRLEEGLIIYHRDYFDAGQMVYENVPLLGSAVRLLRKYAA